MMVEDLRNTGIFWRKHRLIKNKYDAIIVGYPGHIMTPFAKIISRKPIIADLLGSFKDAQIHSHNSGATRRFKDSVIDWMAVKFGDVILIESEAQKIFHRALRQFEKVQSLIHRS